MAVASRRGAPRPLIAQMRRTMLTSGATVTPPSDKTAWQAQHNIDIQRVTQTAIIHELTQQQIHTIEKTVPWFLDEMPGSYFRQVPEEFRMDHLKAISAVHLNLQSHLPDGRAVLTRIRPGTKPGTLLNMVKELPGTTAEFDEYIPLSRVQVFSTKDDSMSLNIFVFGEEKLAPTDIDEKIQILEYAKEVQDGKYISDDRHPKPSPMFDRQNIVDYLHKCSETYVDALSRVDPRRFLKQMELYHVVSGSEGMAVSIEASDKSPSSYWIDIAVANSLPQVALENAAHLLFLHKFDISSAHLDVVKDGENGDVTLLRIMASPTSPDVIQENTFQIMKRELKRTKWLDPSTMELVFDRYPWLGVNRGEIITALCSLMHPVMAKQNALAFSKANILSTVTTERIIPYSAAIADIFLDRFQPRHHLTDEELKVRSEELRSKIDRDVEDSSASELLNKMIDIVHHTLRTNIYLYDRYALGLRLDPKVMELEGDNRDVPYGVLFAHGRNFNAYHVRFRDIARGGMRLVTPPNAELVALESARQYDECYGLAYAQQLKNKDIPEGGSKAVCLINTAGLSPPGKNFAMRKAVKSFADTILDLIVETDETKEQRVDFLGKEEVLYLGPDEQVIPQDINWIVKRAAKRGYDTPNAFMSSKPRTGINHKEYGVTSEGVKVYLDVALRQQLGIDPNTEPFTVKMTGGPDGDVAGNLIKILFRDYGDNCKIVGIADHSGCAEDPEGLSHEELLRLVSEDLNISNFDPSKLGGEGELHLVDTEEGVIARNTMHNRLEADAFIPAGGRPNTIDLSNYGHFLKNDGTPSSPLIVEGANLFVTSLAREQLFQQAGVTIVKDSSANKAGVITSSVSDSTLYMKANLSSAPFILTRFHRFDL